MHRLFFGAKAIFKHYYWIYDMHYLQKPNTLEGLEPYMDVILQQKDLIGNLTGGKNTLLSNSASRKTLESINGNVGA